MNILLTLQWVLLSSGGETAGAVTVDTIMDILKAITSVFSSSNMVAMIAGILGVSVTFVFLWWGVRKGARVVFSAVRSGKFKI